MTPDNKDQRKRIQRMLKLNGSLGRLTEYQSRVKNVIAIFT